MTPSFRQKIEQAQARLTDPAALEETLTRLVEDGELSTQSAASLRVTIPSQVDDARYILGNLGAHLAIGVVFAFDVVPLPLGTICRVSWVLGVRVVETVRRNPSHARVHSLAVLLVAAIPLLGYVAYLIPLRRESSELAFVLANRTFLDRSGRTYEQFLARAPSLVRRLGRWLVPRPTVSSAEDTPARPVER